MVIRWKPAIEIDSLRKGSISIEACAEEWALKNRFSIARGSITKAHVILVTVTDGEFSGRGEAVPSARYGQTISSVIDQINALKHEELHDREAVQEILPPGAARNALDCAFWDLEAKRANKRVWELAAVPVVPRVQTSFTVSLDEPAKMAAVAQRNHRAPILKLKLGGDALDLKRVEGVRVAAPKARLIIDCNESWSANHYRDAAREMKNFGVELIEQPFPAAEDDILKGLDRPVPVCADESCHTSEDLPRIRERYDVVNVKLDKTGGFTEALRLTDAARATGLRLLFGCMVCTSLGIAPARLLPAEDDWVDLDGPLLLAGDRHRRLLYQDGWMDLPAAELWG